jgi:hypothetical protein
MTSQLYLVTKLMRGPLLPRPHTRHGTCLIKQLPPKAQ